MGKKTDFQKSISGEDCIIETVGMFLGTGLEHPRQCDLNLKKIDRPLVLSQNHTKKKHAVARPGGVSTGCKPGGGAGPPRPRVAPLCAVAAARQWRGGLGTPAGA